MFSAVGIAFLQVGEDVKNIPDDTEPLTDAEIATLREHETELVEQLSQPVGDSFVYRELAEELNQVREALYGP